MTILKDRLGAKFVLDYSGIKATMILKESSVLNLSPDFDDRSILSRFMAIYPDGAEGLWTSFRKSDIYFFELVGNKLSLIFPIGSEAYQRAYSFLRNEQTKP